MTDSLENTNAHQAAPGGLPMRGDTTREALAELVAVMDKMSRHGKLWPDEEDKLTAARAALAAQQPEQPNTVHVIPPQTSVPNGAPTVEEPRAKREPFEPQPWASEDLEALREQAKDKDSRAAQTAYIGALEWELRRARGVQTPDGGQR